MSHYTVAVITRTNPEESCELESLLAPFDENLEVDSYIHRTRAEIIADGKKHKQELIERITTEETKDRLIEYLTKPSYRWFRQLLNAETDDDFYEAEVYEDMVGPNSDDEYTTYNPNSKWDWYQIGGRWGYSLRDYNGEYHDTLKIADWDYNYIDPEDIVLYSRHWDVAVEGAEPTEEEKEKMFLFYSADYYKQKYGNKSNYVKSMMTFSTYALLTPDGEWLEPGKMGWWGVSHADPIDQGLWERDFTSLIDTFDKDMYVTIVDCHI